MGGVLLDMVGRVGEADGDEEEDGVLIDMRLIRWMGRGYVTREFELGAVQFGQEMKELAVRRVFVRFNVVND